MFRVTGPYRFIGFILTSFLLVFGLLLLIWGGSTMEQTGEFTIQEGDSAQKVWQQLKEQGYTKRTLPWRYYAWRENAAEKIQAGSYRLEVGEKVRDVIQRFKAGEALPDELTVTFPEGFTLPQIADRVAARGIGTSEEYILSAQAEEFIENNAFLSAIPSGRDLEGYLFPDTYRFHGDDTAVDIIERQLKTFELKALPALQEDALQQSGRTLDEIIIMASIIEREVISDKDMALVSGVLWKRVDEGIGMDADATVRYALNKWDKGLTVQDLAIDSPYNTRKYRGLPPGPISNPGLRAIQAAVNPEQSQYYYYLSTPEGETIFSKTNDEHNANKAKYLR